MFGLIALSRYLENAMEKNPKCIEDLQNILKCVHEETMWDDGFRHHINIDETAFLEIYKESTGRNYDNKTSFTDETGCTIRLVSTNCPIGYLYNNEINRKQLAEVLKYVPREEPPVNANILNFFNSTLELMFNSGCQLFRDADGGYEYSYLLKYDGKNIYRMIYNPLERAVELVRIRNHFDGVKCRMPLDYFINNFLISTVIKEQEG